MIPPPRSTALAACLAMLAIAFSPTLRAQQTAYDGGVIVDYPDPGYSESGAWEDDSGFEIAGQSWTTVRQTEKDGAWAKWTAKLPVAGKYRVYLWHVRCKDPAAKIEITHDGQTETLTRNLQIGHMGWTSVGDYDFAAGSEASVKVTRGSDKLRVDSVKFISLANLKSPAPLPPYPKPDGSLPRISEQGNLILSGQPYQVFYQELHEETTAHPELIAANFDETFDQALAQGVNTLGPMIYWRTFEPEPGVYDYTILDALIEKARARNMHLSLILFFAWRNLQSNYVPAYIRKDHGTYLNDKLADGSDDPHYKVSPFADATRAAETKALTALFRRVLEKDPAHQVVIMAQIENEMPSSRDYSAPALAAWNGQVPRQLLDSLAANEGSINRMIWSDWQKHGHKMAGTWEEVFGGENTGSRIFGSWSAGCYIQALITDLKKVLNIPYYMNAWQHESPCAFSYMDVFHAAVPSLDAMGPDAYGNLEKWLEDVGLSVRSWNHMVIPEEGHTAETMWSAIGNDDALINGQWQTVEGIDWLNSRETYALIDSMASLIASKRGTGEMLGFLQSHQGVGESWSDYFHNLKLTYTATVPLHTLRPPKMKVPIPNEEISNIRLGEMDGCGLLVALGNSEYLLTATRLNVALGYINGGPIAVTDAQGGHFNNGEWVSEGPAAVESRDGQIHFRFPTENRRYGQVRFGLSPVAHNPALAFEAERGKLLREAQPAYKAGASGAFEVIDLKSEGSGVEISTNADFMANSLTIRYACEKPTKAIFLVNGTGAREVEFPATSPVTGWGEKSIAISIARGGVVTVKAGKNVAGPNLDCLILSRDMTPDAAAPSATP